MLWFGNVASVVPSHWQSHGRAPRLSAVQGRARLTEPNYSDGACERRWICTEPTRLKRPMEMPPICALSQPLWGVKSRFTVKKWTLTQSFVLNPLDNWSDGAHFETANCEKRVFCLVHACIHTQWECVLFSVYSAYKSLIAKVWFHCPFAFVTFKIHT